MARVSGDAALPLLGKVFLGVGALLWVLAAVTGASRAASLSGAHEADGTVVEVRAHGKSYVPTVEFTSERGDVVRFEAGVGSNPPEFHVGDHVGVRYPPEHPQDALIDSFWHLWLFPALFEMIGMPFVILGIVLRLRGRKAA